MPSREHLRLLRLGAEEWNRWRAQHPGVLPNFTRSKLRGARLGGAVLAQADFSGADLVRADLSGADLSGASLRGANLSGANLSGAKMTRAHLLGAHLSGADLSRADLRQAGLERTVLVGTNLTGADLTSCSVYGVAAWDVTLDGTQQRDLVLARPRGPRIRVDDLEMAQFVYLLLHSEKIRRAIDAITSKVVLILGRFTPERKAVLDGLRDVLRTRGYVPILFDFEKPSSRDLTETISTLAHLARFIVADITDARSIPQELERIVPDLPSVPVQPLLARSDDEYAMFEHLRRFPWVLPTHVYESQAILLADLENTVVAPAEAMLREQLTRRA